MKFAIPFVYSRTRKKESRISQLLDFSLWTCLGLNQGPPDYENDKMIFCDSSLY